MPDAGPGTASGVTPADLHTRLDGTRLAAVAEFADWTWGQTHLAFLDFEDEVEVADADWSDARQSKS